jgi:hypothetical protein
MRKIISGIKKIVHLRYTINPAMRIKILPLIILINAICIVSSAQDRVDSFLLLTSQHSDKTKGPSGNNDSTVNAIIQKLSSNFPKKISKKTEQLNKQIDKKSEKVLKQMQKQEDRLRRKLAKIDSAAAHNFFTNAENRYNQYLERLNQKEEKISSGLSGEYLPYLDSLKGSISFLQQKASVASLKKLAPESVIKAANQVNQLENKLKQAEDIKEFIRERKSQIKNLLSRYTKLPAGISRNLKNINKEVYYYSAQLKEYKEMFRQPDKIEQKALSLLNKLPAFQNFMKEHSELAGLFGGGGNYTSIQGVTGLQTRSQVISYVQNQVGASGPNAQSLIQKNLQAAQGQVDEIRSKLNALGSSGSDLNMPDFKPNNQKTKTFLQRLEYGSNLQTTHSTTYYPIMTDLGLSVGYKINDKNIIGIGASYKVGWGKDISHVKLTSQGTGFRSFVDINIKKSFFASGGFEYNYIQPFSSISVFNNISNWQQSGLIGITKIVSLNTKMFKKTKVQLLWDFLSYRQRPAGQPLKFRIGYSF